MTGPEPLRLLGLPVHAVTLNQAVLLVERAVLRGQKTEALRHIALNAGKVVACGDHPALAAAVQRAGLVTADGVGVLLLARRLGVSLPERVTGIDLMEALCARAAIRGWPVFLLGAAPGVANHAARTLVQRYPALTIAGTHHGYFDPSQSAAMAERVRASGARLLFVGMNTPRKELFVDAYADAAGVDFAMGVGGAFDVLADRVRRAPLWLQGAGFEWAWRWAQEPRRLFPRYGIDGVRFLVKVAGARRGHPSE